jgi:hypothetical protein
VSSKFWKRRAELLRIANSALNDAAANRRTASDGYWDRNHPSFVEWERAVDDFWAATRAAYPPEFWDMYQRLKLGDVDAADYAIDFLEADPICYRSGYLKADLLRFLGRIPLTEEQLRRLQDVVLIVTARAHSREFRRYCLIARKVDTPSLRDRLGILLECNDEPTRRRASWVLNALNGKVGRVRN